ncbi:MAG: Protein of unknown function DUF664, partial [uncultured Nocardioidaceae bacterium]
APVQHPRPPTCGDQPARRPRRHPARSARRSGGNRRGEHGREAARPSLLDRAARENRGGRPVTPYAISARPGPIPPVDHRGGRARRIPVSSVAERSSSMRFRGDAHSRAAGCPVGV